ncbi:DUF4214 domain-containing protein [Marivita sp. XM-24bin2]|jgi:hypothetical protein|uniref:DUF4214 domain-containing protein n=1 Tax=Marivita sp. XM-24bin2 TaxID=2133951 RepID=UPI000D78ECA6|nr:DUF4214 domain-containing protein [Marivita sp. XM-24bin2]MCR9111153.1 DUF4214 domain-containing protein [Paracoccaceae bacterium]PWL32749.1 MAG: hypothetical protein DCO97_20940 [Marivita sp. XM-24bin2]
MALVEAFQSFDMSDTTVWFGVLTEANDNLIEVTAGARVGQYIGNFSYGTDAVFGQVTEVREEFNGSLVYRVSDMSLDAFEVFQAVDSGDTAALQRLALSGADRIIGSGMADYLIAYAGNDTISSGGGDDSIQASEGTDIIDGGAGTDILFLVGNQSEYTLTLQAGSTRLEDRVPNGLGVNYVENIERLDFEQNFGGQPWFDLASFSGLLRVSQPELESFIELYIAYFNRAPDAVGLNFWGTSFSNGITLSEIAALFSNQVETLSVYPQGTSNETFATTVYNNVLGRTPDQSGISFWVEALDSGNVSRDQFILEVLQGAKAALKPEQGQAFVDQQIADRAYLETKTDIGEYFSVHKGMSNVQHARTVMELYDGTAAGTQNAVDATFNFHQAALDAFNGEFLMPIVGLIENPFEIA